MLNLNNTDINTAGVYICERYNQTNIIETADYRLYTSLLFSDSNSESIVTEGAINYTITFSYQANPNNAITVTCILHPYQFPYVRTDINNTIPELYSISITNTSTTITIHIVHLNHAGIYDCTFNNGLTGVYSAAHTLLRVRERLAPLWPSIG
ncbi:hypothetical protein, partial [Salmonella sp. s51228]|uniref:hypothetical protein n=1 Tax=Salmonella sp. s51228 TaxID=3159652 RepID=UPI00397FA742